MPDSKPFSKVRIELGEDHVGLGKDLKVGGKVRVVVYGTLKAIAAEAADDITTEGQATGRLEIDATGLKVASNNEIAELFDDEFDG